MLVTGGAGFIGSNFVRQLLAAGEERVINLDLLTYAGRRENLADLESHPDYLFQQGDIRDQALVDSIMVGTHPAMIDADFGPVTKVVHFAAESHVDRSITGPEVFVSTNIHGTMVLLEGAKKAWRSAHGDITDGVRFLHVSTDEVYGSLGATGYFTEETPLAANSPYSASKAGSDLLVRAYGETYGLPVLITRCSNNYGPYQLPEKLIPVVIDRILDRQPIPVYGDGKNIRDWLYVGDHCTAILRVLEQGRLGDVYNIGGHNEWTNIDIVGHLCDLIDERTEHTNSRSLITFVEDRLGHDRRYAIDAAKMERELDWRPTHTFETGIAETVDWYLANRDWVNRAKSGL
jgi:dTDP-glucose 4,6-dehydratase